MKVLIADKFETERSRRAKAAGCDVLYQSGAQGRCTPGALCETGADVLVVRSTAVTDAMLDAGRLSLIVRAGAGYNTIDVAAASRRGIYVSNCPGKNAVAVAELAFGLILALDRRIPDNVADLRAGRWNKKEYSKASGAGRPHARAARVWATSVRKWRVAPQASACQWSSGAARSWRRTGRSRTGRRRRSGSPACRLTRSSRSRLTDRRCATLQILSVHLALTTETRGLVNADVLGRAQAGRDLHQHGARRDRRRRGARAGGARARAPSRTRRLRGRAAGRHRRVQRCRSHRCRTSTEHITSAPRPIRRRRRLPPRRCGSSAPTRKPARCRTS